MTGLVMFFCEESDGDLIAATSREEAERLLREHRDLDRFPEKPVTLTEMKPTDELTGWARWDGDLQAHVLVKPAPTVAQVLDGFDGPRVIPAGDDDDVRDLEEEAEANPEMFA